MSSIPRSRTDADEVVNMARSTSLPNRTYGVDAPPHLTGGARPRLFAAVAAMALALAGCTGVTSPGFSYGNSNSGSGDDTAPPTTDTGDTGPGPTDTGTEAGFDNPGDVVQFSDDQGTADIDLTDASGDSNQDQEFYLVVVNTSESDIGFRLRYTTPSDSSGSSDTATPLPAPSAPSPKRSAPGHAGLRRAIHDGRVHAVTPADPPPPPLSSDDIGVSRREFHVRDNVEDDTSYTTVGATLWALGDGVAIWVDDSVPIDWDYQCDGTIDQYDYRDSYGFNNCDLQTIADIVDTNIAPNLENLFGDVSDVNGDGLVTVVITPVLNEMSLTSSNSDDWTSVIGSYADPDVDLNTWDATDNPGSDEQEVLYVFAPDPYGHYNPYATTTVDEYTSMELAAQIARAFQSLVSYNQHVLIAGGDAEETWLREGMSAVAADLTGFGAPYYDDAWDYMDAPHLHPLVDTEDEGAINTISWGAQYLFVRWLVDNWGTDILSSLTQTSSTGMDNVQAATGTPFDNLVVEWQVALLTTGVTRTTGDALVPADTYPPFADATTITAPTQDPAPGDYYGANGYQMGIQIKGVNQYMSGGTTSAPAEVDANRVTLGNTDHYTMVTGVDSYGYVLAGQAAQVWRLTDIPLDAAELQIEATGSGYVGAVVRWNDPTYTDYTVEDIFSATDETDMPLPDLPADGEPVYAVGEISDPGTTLVVDDSGDEQPYDVYDTDRWELDLSDVPSNETRSFAIWLDRRYSGTTGDVAPADPWLAVVPSNLLPSPTVDGTQRGDCTSGVDFGYPASVIEYLYYQVFLSGNSTTTTTTTNGSTAPSGCDYGDTGAPSGFDPCGCVTGDTTCGDDWDRDGVLDVDEPMPTSIVQQVNVMQCTLAGGDSSGFEAKTATDILDVDETDEDSLTTVDRSRNLGSRSGASGEEAYKEVVLQGGQPYVIVVGAGTDTGSYELTIQPLD